MDLFDLHLSKLQKMNLIGMPQQPIKQSNITKPTVNLGLKKGGGLATNEHNPMLKNKGLHDDTNKLNENNEIFKNNFD